MEVKRKNSRKRSAIYSALASSKAHPSAEMLYNCLKTEYPELSLGTVYRNLSVLEDEGLVVSVANVAGQERYDACTLPHAHFVCRCCRKVEDVELPEGLDRLGGELWGGAGFTAESFMLTVSGVCADCGRIS